MSVISSGSFGTVVKHSETRAIKYFNSPSLSTDFLREVLALQALQRTGVVVRVFDIQMNPFQNHIEMELALGTLLSHPPTNIVDASRQILEAVAVCHQHHILHLDLKSENFLVFPNGKIKLADFGLALPMYNGRRLFNFHYYTPNYRAPEILLHIPFTEKAEVWAMGCVIVELLTKEPLFSDTHVLISILEKIGDPVHSGDSQKTFQALRCPDEPRDGTLKIPQEFQEVVRGMLTYDPANRWTIQQALDFFGGSARELTAQKLNDPVNAVCRNYRLRKIPTFDLKPRVVKIFNRLYYFQEIPRWNALARRLFRSWLIVRPDEYTITTCFRQKLCDWIFNDEYERDILRTLNYQLLN